MSQKYFLKLQGDAIKYLHSLELFSNKYHLEGLLIPPVDHLAIKTKNSQDFEDKLHQFLPLCHQASYIKMQNRRLATLKLIQPISFGQLGESDYLEIMEPKPEKVGQGFSGLEHIEIYTPKLKPVEEILQNLGVDFTYYENPNHKALVLIVNPQGQEIKFTDCRLGDIVNKQIKNGESKVIK